MNITEKFDKAIIFRFLVSISLAGAALVLFLMNRSTLEKPVEKRQRDVKEIVADVDHEVDTVLAHFQIEKKWIRKQQIPIPNSQINRTERRILIPTDLLPVQVNLMLNTMAKRYNGRAIASENLKENSVTIHIELEGYIVQTIILKPSSDLQRRKNEKDRTST